MVRMSLKALKTELLNTTPFMQLGSDLRYNAWAKPSLVSLVKH
jgi:hypothetical protein